MKACKTCGQPLPPIPLAAMEERRRIKSKNISAGLLGRKASGQHIGRPKVCSDARVRFLRNQGLTYKAIAEALGVSRGSVWYSLKMQAEEAEKP